MFLWQTPVQQVSATGYGKAWCNNMYKSKYDVIVVGSGPGGIAAALASARRGVHTLLVERNAHLGGLLTSGLPLLAYRDRAGNQVVGGIGQEICDRLKEVGGANEHLRSPLLNSITHVNQAWMNIILFEMCEEQEFLDVMLYAEMEDVKVVNGAIKGITVFCKGEKYIFDADIVVDGTGDGHVIFKAGAKYLKAEVDGPRGMQSPSLCFELANVDYDKIIAYLEEHPEEYNVPDTFQGFAQNMEHFKEKTCFTVMGFYNLVKQARENGEFNIPRNMIDFGKQLTGNAFVNVARAVNSDCTDAESMIQAEFTNHRQVKEIIFMMKKYIPGFENCQLASLMPYTGTRESRRLVGKKQMTLQDVLDLSIPEDTIALAGYNMDTHSPKDGQMYLIAVEHGVGIPYGCLVSENVEGLLAAGRDISADQDAFAMIRVMPTCLAIGEAAGVAAALSIQQGCMPSALDVSLLRKELLKNGAILSLPETR